MRTTKRSLNSISAPSLRLGVVVVVALFSSAVGQSQTLEIDETVEFEDTLPLMGGFFAAHVRPTLRCEGCASPVEGADPSFYPVKQVGWEHPEPPAPSKALQSVPGPKGKVASWWLEPTSAPLRSSDQVLPIDIDSLFALTAKFSGRVQAVAQTTWVSQMQLEQSQAAFDPMWFSNNRFDSTSDPVENTLTTGGPPRLEDEILDLDTGMRGQTASGTNYRFGQSLGHKSSNSNFFVPNDQGKARVYAKLTHPLMRGRSIDVNRSLVLTAHFETFVAQAQYQETLQKQLFDVADTYWKLYYERASLIQRRYHLARALEIAEQLSGREDYDSAPSQILRARATIASRRAELAEADARIRNQESQLRSLVNAPQLVVDRNAEFLPIQQARLYPIRFDMAEETDKALKHRPELFVLINRKKAVEVRQRLANDQLKPTLNLVAEGYAAGIEGNSDFFGAWKNQFSTGRPGYAAGLIYERPLGNRLAKASVRERTYEMAQVDNLIREASETIRTEVETAIRSVEAARMAVESREMALMAVNEEMATLKDRWLMLGNDPRLGQLQLNDLLDAQNRVFQEEQNLLQSLVYYNKSLLEVQRATGALVRFAE